MIEQFKKWAKENIGADDHSLVTVGKYIDNGMRFRLPKMQREYEKWKQCNTEEE